jgi:CheY-like chemotaxis protein
MEFAQSAAKALQRIADAEAASLILIVSDINMLGMSGLQLLPKTRAARPDVPDSPSKSERRLTRKGFRNTGVD